MKKVIITGGSGFIGSRFIRRWQKSFDILSPTHQELDITNKDAVVQYVKKNGADVILHTAAISNTGYCEEHPEESYLVNTLATTYLAEAAKAIGAKFVFFSSDQIYNGNKEEGLLSEDIDVAPVNHYGRHKLEAENRVLEIARDAVALRATWMYDIPREGMPAHPNFYTNLSNAIKEESPLQYAIYEHRGITNAREVIELLPLTFDLPGGVYNYGAENALNTYDTAYAFAYIRYGKDVAEKVVKADKERFAQQPRNISISMDKIRQASDNKIYFTNTFEGLLEWEKKYKEYDFD